MATVAGSKSWRSLELGRSNSLAEPLDGLKIHPKRCWFSFAAANIVGITFSHKAIRTGRSSATMSGETVEKRLRDDSSPHTPCNPNNKRRKGEEDAPEMVVSGSQGPKVDPSELASAFALASLASLSPSSGEKPSKLLKEETRREQISFAGRLVEETVSVSGSWETRSPKADLAPVTPEVRAPAGLSSFCSSRRVHFAPNTKEHLERGQAESVSPQQIHQGHQAGKQRAPLTPTTPLPTNPHLSASPHRGIVTLSPRSPQALGRGAFVPRSPHPYRMNTLVRSPNRQLHHLLPPYLAPPHHHQLRHASQVPQHQPIHCAYSCGRGHMFPPPTRLMQPPLLHPENQWICDYCNVAAFATYEDACMHEETCKLSCIPRPVIREQHAVTRMRRQGPRTIVKSSGGPPQVSTVAQDEASRSDSSDEEGSAASTAPVLESVLLGDQAWYTGSISLSIEDSDHEWLSELNCFVRKYCVEAFSASASDVSKTSKRGRIAIDQVGIRCCFCAHLPLPDKAAAAVSFPTSVAGIYESVKRWQRVHLEVCREVPAEVQTQLSSLANTNVWVPTTRQYWTDSAKALGLVDTCGGIRFGFSPDELRHKSVKTAVTISGDEEKDSGKGIRLSVSAGLDPAKVIESAEVTESWKTSITQDNTGKIETGAGSGYIVLSEDMEMIPPYVYFLMRQVESCRFTEADRFVARSKGPVGYPGFQCRHCNGHAGLGKYFPVSAKSLSTNSTSQNIHAHLLKCRKCPDRVKDYLVQLKIEKSRSPRMEPGWRKVFFDRVWTRLHG